MLNNITKVKQLRTEYVQIWSFSRCLLLGEKKNPKRLRRVWEPIGWKGPTTECDFVIFPKAKSVQWARIPSNWGLSMFLAFLATALWAITVYRLVFTPILLFPYTVTRLESFSPHGVGRFSIGSSQKSPSSPGHRWCMQCPMSGHYPLWCGWEPVSKCTRQGW